MNFIHLIERAISTQPEDHSVLKEFFNREYKKAERDHFYTKESFLNGLLEVLTRKKNLIRKKFDNRKTDLEKIINKIDTYIIPYPQISDIPFDEINMDEYRKDKRNKLLKQSKEELKDITIYNYKNNIAPFAKVELIEKVINELFNKTTTETDPAKQNDKDYTTLQWSTIFYFIEPDLYGEITLKKDRIHRFRLDFKLSNSKNALSNDHNEITRVINGDEKNELKQHHINTIKAILPYLEKNYHEAFTNAIEDLSLLQDKLDRK